MIPVDTFKDSKILITGGAGSIGTRLVTKLLEHNPHSLRVMDSSEYNLFRLRELVKRDERVRMLLGNVRSKERMRMAVRGVDIVIHMAAIKHIDIAYYNIEEAIMTNIYGTSNVVHTCMDEPSVKKVVFISSDKAVNPTGLYGVTKLIGEKLFHWASDIQTEKAFGILRFGNVFESSGNVFEVWKMQKQKGLPVSVTSKEMKRYFWTLRDCVNFTMKSINTMQNGDTFVPKMQKHSIYDLAIKRGFSVKLTSPRRDEKYDEDLMTVLERKTAEDRGSFWLLKYGHSSTS